MTTLILKRASASRPSGEWSEDDFDVLADAATSFQETAADGDEALALLRSRFATISVYRRPGPDWGIAIPLELDTRLGP
jgi:hypothetical protein